jgi:hypothetical protein
MSRTCLACSLVLLAAPLLSQAEPPPAPNGPPEAGRQRQRRPDRVPAKPKLDPAVYSKLPPVEPATATAEAVKVLLGLPEGDGKNQWPYEGVYREDQGQLPIGYRVGGTAIVGLGLIAAPGYAQDKARQEALAKGVGFILETLAVPRMQIEFEGTYDVRGWGHIYALQLFLELKDHGLEPKAHADAIAERTRWLVQALVESRIPETGGWNYSRPKGYLAAGNRASTFMTAPALQALFHAKARGHEVVDEVLDQALDALVRARAEPGGYAYGAPDQSQHEVSEEQLTMMDKTPSSAARATAVESTLLLAGRGDQARLRRAIDRFFLHWEDLAVRKSQTGTHIPPYGIAPYYFLFGHVYAAQAIELVDDTEAKTTYRKKMLQYMAFSREGDGGWNDRQFDRSAGYGTAMAILAMQMPNLHRPVARPAAPAAAADKKR